MIAIGLLTLSLWMPQSDTLVPVDSIRPKVGAIKPAFNLDFRNSFLERQHVNVLGVNAGIEFGVKRHQLTLGYYWINYATYLRLIDWRRDAARRINLDYYTRTDMWYLSMMYWWNMTNNKKWMVSVPVELGGGVASALPTDLNKETSIDHTHQSFFVPVQVGIYSQWRATRWVGLSAQIGYRVSVFQTAINENFSGSYYSIGLTIYPALVTDVWRWIRKGDRISPLHKPEPQKK